MSAEWLRYHGTDTAIWPFNFNGNIGAQMTRVAGEDEEKHKYYYDNLNRLVRDQAFNMNVYYPHEVFDYDANGNRTQYYLREGFNGVTDTLTYHNHGRSLLGNRLDTLFKNGVTNNRFAYDANGNLLLNVAKQMSSYYDIYNQLDTVFRDNGSLPDNALSFGYSVGGERVWKQYRYSWVDTCSSEHDPLDYMIQGDATDDLGVMGDTPLFWDSLGGMQTDGTTPPPGGGPHYCTYYDTVLTWYIVSNGKVLAEYDGLTRQLHYKYIYAGDQRIAMRDGVNRLHYYLNDHLGSARVVIDSTGAIKDKYHYLAFGSSLDVTFSTGQPNRYTGKPYDMDAGMNLYYYGARYYDGEGRFTQIDPLRNKYPEWGPYVYTLCNPIRLIDRDGLKPGDPFTSTDAAAIDFGMEFNGRSILDNKEYGTVIYSFERSGSTFYSYSEPKIGGPRSTQIDVSRRDGALVATAHSHAAYDPNYENNDFSRTGIQNDVKAAKDRGVPSYVATPNGSLLKYEPTGGTTTRLSTNLPSDPKDPKRINNVAPGPSGPDLTTLQYNALTENEKRWARFNENALVPRGSQ